MQGKCNCSAVQINLARVVGSGLCHCTVCRKLTGSLAKPYLACPPDAFTVQGEPKRYERHDGASGKVVYNYFCGTCGSQLWSKNSLSDNTYVNGGIFEPGTLPAPMEEIYTASMDPWEQLHPGVHVVTGSQDN